MSGDSGIGFADPTTGANEFNITSFIVRRLLTRVRTCVVVQINSVTTSGGVAAVGFCSATPLVSMVDGQNNAVPHGQINNLCYFRLQGGQNAVIIDPQVNDVGLALICDRDISNLKANAPGPSASVPQTPRQFDLADGIYLGGILNGIPKQYVQFLNGGGINIVDQYNNSIQMTQAGIVFNPVSGTAFINGSLALSGSIVAQDGHSTYAGNIKTSGAIIAGFGGADQVGLQTHTHTQPNDSHGDTEAATAAPTAGT